MPNVTVPVDVIVELCVLVADDVAVVEADEEPVDVPVVVAVVRQASGVMKLKTSETAFGFTDMNFPS